MNTIIVLTAPAPFGITGTAFTGDSIIANFIIVDIFLFLKLGRLLIIFELVFIVIFDAFEGGIFRVLLHNLLLTLVLLLLDHLSDFFF